MAAVVVAMVAMFLVVLAALAASVALLVKAVAAGGIIAAAAHGARTAATKKAGSNIGAYLVVVLGVIGTIVYLLQKSRLEPVPDTDEETVPDLRPGPRPTTSPLPPTIIKTWEDEGRPRCYVRPEHLNTFRQPFYTGNGWQIDRQTGRLIDPDRDTFGGGIFHIGKNKDEYGVETVRIDGIVQDAIPRLIAPNYQNKLSGLAGSIGLPGGLYHLSHLWGPGFGSEARAGMYLGPQVINQGAQENSEQWIRDLHEYAKTLGTVPGSPYARAWVEATGAAQTFAPGSVVNLSNHNIGGNLLQRVDYEATLCAERTNGDVVQETYSFGFKVDPPVFNARTGAVTAGGIYDMYAQYPPNVIPSPRR